jgi:hypothetical protein
MAAASSYTECSAYLKKRYVDKIAYVIPKEDKLTRDISLKRKDGFGDSINQPVEVTPAQGMTFGGSDSGAFAINTPVSGVDKEASIKPSSFCMNGKIAQDLLDRLGTGKQSSFEDGIAMKVKSLTDQASFAKEICLMHGGNSLGTFDSRISGSGTTTQVYRVSTGTFMPALIQRLLEANIDVYYGSTKINATGTIRVSAVDLSTRYVTLVGLAAELDDIYTNLASSPGIYPQGAYGNTMLGLFYIAGTTSSTIHGISQSTYSSWASNTMSAGSTQLSYDAIYEGVVQLAQRGCAEDLFLYCSPRSAKDLKTQLVQLEKKSPGSTKFESKTSILTFDDVNVTIKSHLYCKPNEAVLFSPDAMERVGFDTEFVSFGSQGTYVMHMEEYNGAFFRVHWNQALFVKKPSYLLKVTGIVNKGD